jgi:predicted ATPase/DNA-binding SARP family transcriptional activator
MRPQLEVRMFGAFQVLCDGAPVAGFESDQVRALLAYLAVESEQPHRREWLAELLWPDEPESVAAHRLRQALANLRHVLGDREAAVPALRVTRADVQLNPVRGVRSDLAAFRSLVRGVRVHPHRRLELCHPCARRLRQAAALVRGRFLGGLASARSAPFADWAAAQGERVLDEAGAVFDLVTVPHERRGEYADALVVARRSLEMESWRESAHRAVMRSLAATGDRAGALRQYRQCERLLRDELGIAPDAETRALDEAIRAGAPAAPARRTPPPLPPQPTSFVGRAAELEQLLDLIARERIVTLIGPGGAGKTRLALRLAEELARDLPGRVWIVELDRVADPERAIAAVAVALALGEGGRAEPLDGVAERLRGGDALLVLDNCEHLRGECARLVAHLARACPDLCIVATSREPLRVRGEVVWAVPPLALPPLQTAPASTDVASDAVDLFVERAREAHASFRLGPENARAVSAICRRLDGMPLALELAASWVRMIAPETLLSRLEDPLALAGLTLEDAAPRHRSLRDVLDWSHDLLLSRERVLLRRLGAFRGGWSLDAAEAVCADAPTEAGALARADVLAALATLFDTSLVLIDDGPTDVRYRLLETVRQYARERLDAAGEVSALADRHAGYYLELAEASAPELRRPEQHLWRARLERERPNLDAAHDWLVSQVAVAPAHRLAAALGWFWHVGGYWRTGYEQTTRALALPDGCLAPARARALGAAGLLAFDLGMLGPAAEWLQGSQDLAHAGGDRAAEAEALNALGLVALGRDNRAAGQHLDAALAIAEALGDRWLAGRTLWNLADLHGVRGDTAAARALMGRAVEEMRAVGVRQGVGVALGAMARIVQEAGDRAEARQLFRDSLELQRPAGIRYGVVTCLRGLARIDAEDGDTASAAALLAEAHLVAREMGATDVAQEIERDLVGLAVGPQRERVPAVG